MDSSEKQQRKTSSIEEDCLFAMQLACASVLPMVMKVEIELDVLETISREGPGAHLSPSEIASHLPTHNPEAPIMLDRMLRLLASYTVLTCSLTTHADGKL
ncbi:hypothetical protein HHK36_029273 [Tetracentron sinense]|uniref:O-methyltransferase dimerisation domain-containing protein n=1 Tax=Tetracentron sinense TaxID=13715 RepID=A0A834YHN0_TETSI|nr:hypothetical protein HHK36_029273 [Tetracentron sinense]